MSTARLPIDSMQTYLKKAYEVVSFSIKFSMNTVSWLNKIPYVTSFAKQLKTSLIGDFDNILINRSVKFKPSTLDPINITMVDFGLFGKIYQINTADAYQIGPMLNQLDKTSYGRLGYQTINYLTNGLTVFSESGEKAVDHRKLIKLFLTQNKYSSYLTASIETVRQAVNVDQEIEINENWIRQIIYTILAKVIFNVDQIPPETNHIVNRFLDHALDFRNQFFCSEIFLRSKSTKIKNEYFAYSEKFLLSQLDDIMTLLKSYENNQAKNIIVETIVDLIQTENPKARTDKELLYDLLGKLSREEVKRYFNNDLIKAYSSIFTLAANITTVLIRWLECCIGGILSKQKIMDEVRDLFPESDVAQLTFDDIQKLKQLDYSYQFCLRRGLDGNIGVLRYTDKELAIKKTNSDDKVVIPAKSYINVPISVLAQQEIQSIKESDKFQFTTNKSIMFSVHDHHRSCPGFKVAEIMFKSIALTLSQLSYQFIPVKKGAAKLVKSSVVNEPRKIGLN